MGLWTRKDIAVLRVEAALDEGQVALGAAGPGAEMGFKRVLSAYQLVMLGIGCIVGAGIFVITGAAAAQYAGPGVMLSFVLAALGCLFAGLCYAEFSSMIPVAGSAYTYAYATLGEFIAWLIGWDLILEYLVAASTVAVGWSGYFTAFMSQLGLDLPPALANAPFQVVGTHELVATGAILNLPAMFLIAAITTVLVIGIEVSARFNNLMVFIKVGVVLLVIAFGISYVRMENLTPFIPENTGEFGHFGWSGVLRASGVVFFAYIGFDAVSAAAQEARNPQRDMPIGILGSLAICTILYILMALVMTGIAHYSTLNVPHPVFKAIEAVGPALHWLTPIINVGAIVGLASVVLVLLVAQPRIFYAMSRDGLLPKFFGAVHPRFRTPYKGTILTGVFAMILSGLFPIGLLGEMVSIGTLSAFVVVCAGILVLRHTQPELARPFRTPFVPFVPLAGIGVCGYMMSGLPVDTWYRLIIWMAIGLVIYFCYGRRTSKMGRRVAAE